MNIYFDGVSMSDMGICLTAHGETHEGKRKKVSSISEYGGKTLIFGWRENVKKNTKQAIIRAEKVLWHDRKRIKITGFENVQEAVNLPSQYLKGCPRFVTNGPINNIDKIFITFENSKQKYLTKGMLITESEFDEIISEMKQAGKRLAEINREIEAEWEGEIEVKI